MLVLVNDILKGEGRVDGAKLCLSAGSQLPLLIVLGPLYHDTGIQPADGLAN